METNCRLVSVRRTAGQGQPIMNEMSAEDKAAVSDLAFYMLKEAYISAVQAFSRHDVNAARELIQRVEEILTSALQTMHGAEAEGPRTREIVLALGSKLVGVFDQAHQELPDPTPSSAPPSVSSDWVAGRQAFAYFASLNCGSVADKAGDAHARYGTE